MPALIYDHASSGSIAYRNWRASSGPDAQRREFGRDGEAEVIEMEKKGLGRGSVRLARRGMSRPKRPGLARRHRDA